MVYERDGQVVGFGSGTVIGDTTEAEIETLYMLRWAQGNGDGRRLMIEIAGRLQRLGAMSLTLWMADGNPTAGFYERMGGTVVEKMAKPFGPFTITEVCYRWDRIGDLTGYESIANADSSGAGPSA